MKPVIQFVLLFLPWFCRKRLLRAFLGFQIGERAYIGFSILICDRVRLASNTRIGHLNYFRGLKAVELGESATIGNLNWFTATPRLAAKSAADSRLILGRQSAITNRHYFDVQALFAIGEFTTIAGIRSTFLTHAIDLGRGEQTVAGITIGDYCFLSTNICVLCGCSIASRTVVAAGAVVAKTLAVEATLYGGVPAKALKSLPGETAYFTRRHGKVV